MSLKVKAGVVLLVLVGIALLVGAFITGRGATDTARPAATSTTSAPAAIPSRTATDQPSSPADVDDQAAAGSVNPAVTAAPHATRAMTAFLRPGSSTTPERWWAGLAPLLTAGARQDYAPTDPTQVEATKITGAPAPISPEGDPAEPDVGAEGEVVLGVPTDAGLYAVWVVTEGPETGKVSRISPAES